ncbi:MAG: hypothetical protein FWD17_02880 [Polyangiaceae bacterium]|nr:hypothetical protein [Polyangiaceae bacterium]
MSRASAQRVPVEERDVEERHVEERHVEECDALEGLELIDDDFAASSQVARSAQDNPFICRFDAYGWMYAAKLWALVAHDAADQARACLQRASEALDDAEASSPQLEAASTAARREDAKVWSKTMADVEARDEKFAADGKVRDEREDA